MIQCVDLRVIFFQEVKPVFTLLLAVYCDEWYLVLWLQIGLLY